MVRKILFLLRSHNDIDHALPLIYRFAENDRHCVVVANINHINHVAATPHAELLRSKFGLEIADIYTLAAHTTGQKLLRRLVRKVRPATRKLLLRWHRQSFDRSWAKNLLSEHNIGVVVVDIVNIDKFVYRQIAAAAKCLGIKVVAIPHSVLLFELNPVTRANNYHRLRNWYWADELLVTSTYDRTVMINSGVDQTNISVMGSPRFCTYSRSIYDAIRRPFATETGNKLKVLYLAGTYGNLVDRDKESRMVQVLTGLKFVFLTVKPHPRVMEDTPEFYRWPENLYLATHVPSADLITWADIVITASSSVVLEAYIQEKPHIYPEFLHPRDSVAKKGGALFVRHKTCTRISTPEDLGRVLSERYHEPADLKPAAENVARLFRDVVYGGGNVRDICAEYCQKLAAINHDSKASGGTRGSAKDLGLLVPARHSTATPTAPVGVDTK